MRKPLAFKAKLPLVVLLETGLDGADRDEVLERARCSGAREREGSVLNLCLSEDRMFVNALCSEWSSTAGASLAFPDNLNVASYTGERRADRARFDLLEPALQLPRSPS